MFSFLESGKIDSVTDVIGIFILHGVPLAPYFLLFLEEAGIPLPIPGDVYLAFVGYQVSRGKIAYPVAFITLMFSILAGSSVLFFLSSRYGNWIILKLGKYIHLNEEKLVTVEKHFKKYGVWAIIFGRHIPGFRIPITFFAGISGVSYTTFILSTFVSVIFWIIFYLSVGARLGRSVLRLFHADPAYYLLLSIPLILFIGSIAYTRIKNKKTTQRKQ